MTDAELGLNAEQSRDARSSIFIASTAHPAYSSSGNKGPGLKRLYQKPYLPSGLTANDEHVMQSIVRGRGMMPPFGNQLDQQELEEVIAYLHTL